MEAITEVKQDSIVEVADPDRTEDSNQLLQDIRFKVTIRGWSHRTQQHRSTALLSLQNEAMSKRMQENQDLILLPVTWCPLAMDTLDPNELGWWYKVSDPIRFKVCKACVTRIREDVQTGHQTLNIRGCPKCPVGRSKRIHPTSRKQHGGAQTVKDKITEVRRSLRLITQTLSGNVYCEIDEDECVDSATI